MPRELFSPLDVDEAHEAWSANCGPCSLAAVLRVPALQVRHCFPDFPERPWTTLGRMEAALLLARRGFLRMPPEPPRLPRYGLVIVQVLGSWWNPGVPIGAQLKRTHWIGHALLERDGQPEQWVYDVNAGQWVPYADWDALVLPVILEQHRGNTGWRVRAALEVANG